jgi:hypothetical protein
MSKIANPQPEKLYPPELKDLFERATRGDQSVLPELKRAYDEYPELAAKFGDLRMYAEESLLTLIFGSELLGKEAVRRQLVELRGRLGATSELEKLLVDRVCLCWLEVHHLNSDLAGRLANDPSGIATQAMDKLLHRAHARYLSAIKQLAIVEKLVRPPLSTLDMLHVPVPETVAAKPRRQAVRRSVAIDRGVAVMN